VRASNFNLAHRKLSRARKEAPRDSTVAI
jgi:hypothetical protein